MARIEIDEFSHKDIARIFIAGRIREAERAETLLTENGVPYAVQIEEFFEGGLLSVGVRKGAAFYILSSQRDFCRRLFFENGLKTGWIDEEE
jgi:hypothetical protein